MTSCSPHAPPPDAVVDMLSRNKPGVVALLRPRRDGRSAEDWQIIFEEKAGVAEFDLPNEPYRYAEWKRCVVAPDYHVEIADHYYSVPFGLLRETVEARLTDTTVEVFHKGKRVASHPRSSLHHRHTTIAEHMPSAHRRYAEWTPQRLMREAAKVGPATIALIEAIMKAKPHPEQGFRSCLGIISLVRTYGDRKSVV